MAMLMVHEQSRNPNVEPKRSGGIYSCQSEEIKSELFGTHLPSQSPVYSQAKDTYTTFTPTATVLRRKPAENRVPPSPDGSSETSGVAGLLWPSDTFRGRHNICYSIQGVIIVVKVHKCLCTYSEQQGKRKKHKLNGNG